MKSRIKFLPSGTKIYVNNLEEWHREDGPAFEGFNGTIYWFLNNVECTEEEWFDRLTPEQKDNYIWNI